MRRMVSPLRQLRSQKPVCSDSQLHWVETGGKTFRSNDVWAAGASVHGPNTGTFGVNALLVNAWRLERSRVRRRTLRVCSLKQLSFSTRRQQHGGVVIALDYFLHSTPRPPPTSRRLPSSLVIESAVEISARSCMDGSGTSDER